MYTLTSHSRLYTLTSNYRLYTLTSHSQSVVETAGSYQWIFGGKVNTSLLVVPNSLTKGNEVCGLLYTGE